MKGHITHIRPDCCHCYLIIVTINKSKCRLYSSEPCNLIKLPVNSTNPKTKSSFLRQSAACGLSGLTAYGQGAGGVDIKQIKFVLLVLLTVENHANKHTDLNSSPL